MSRERQSRMNGRGEIPVDYYEPRVFTFYRDPYDPADQNEYEQAVCHRRQGYTRPKHTADYCNNWFLPQFGRYNASTTHQALYGSTVRAYLTGTMCAMVGV